MFGRKTRTTDDRERGQSLVELTLGMAVLVLLISGLVDLGRAYFIFVALEDGAGEAALYLSINPDCWDTSGTGCADPNNALYRATHAGGSYVDWDNPSTVIQVCPPPPGAVPDISDTEYWGWCSAAGTLDGLAVGDTVTVSVKYYFDLLTPLIPNIAGVNPLPLRAEASQWVVTEPGP